MDIELVYLFLYIAGFGFSEIFIEYFHIKSIGSRLLYYAVLLFIAFFINNINPLNGKSPM